ncbi:hypothetical protein DTO006G1_4595 [Penicillium roqueforti]|uniref:uncharacterized protein n=1 Tax=Penicillium roqueforti TaxID=5082 RepID=UPI00190C47CF|nr:uncharacterized protein LCP9604111_2778 [Penicillium roqueforti]KAF9251377.1 hypothetical protein LCP9604111_2778 [Penicillium roqueforti]KAI1837746.1 hypothetical protein CBS147337_969 [Penicillium roqueforti]KAI2681849.1 hypothetical protein CBS147355_3059 [Penicillium roqueforti]KAI2689239.1 hypothetical protein LCP963914a_2328 [Penicillium roqueforti]KAI2716655.1 hypothetical protein CBS147354_6923 [Penicillium roqueforti]
MSAVDSARFRLTTPPRLSLEEYIGSGHSRHVSNSSVYSSESSPWSTMTGNTSPTTSPTRHYHGPKLLPKIRPQDVVIEPVSAGGPLRNRRVLSNTRNPPPGFIPYPLVRPSVNRTQDVADRLTLASPISPAPMTTQGCFPALSSPVTITPSYKRKAGGSHSRSVSASVIDAATLTRFGYPTYRELPKYAPQMQAQTTPTTPVTPITPNIMPYPSYSQRLGVQNAPATPLTVPTPQYNYRHASAAQHSPVSLSPQENLTPRSTTLLSYLTLPIQPINLVRNVSVIPTRGLHDYFWWDIRNLRSWSSFSLAAFDSLDSRLIQLLKTEIPAELTPHVAVSPASLAPESEHDLVSLIRDLYAPPVNAALAVSQGEDHLQLYAAPDVRNTGQKNHGHPHFLANYASDTEQTSAGLPRGRLVGIVKSFDRWNTGMRNEAPHRRVKYLNGLAHLQRCMREHSCRYGFIITEIELVCVRAGCDTGDDIPYFGYLEIAASIPLKTAATRSGRAHARDAPLTTPISARSFSSSFPSHHDSSDPDPVEDALPAMTAGLGLYFLLMLSKSVPLPHQPSAHLNVGGPGAMTRQRILEEPKDKWIPEPQVGEKRDAKRVRGWVWPSDPWHRREGGASRRKAGTKAGAKTKKWHK